MASFTLQQLNLLKAKQKALVEQIEKEKIQSNKGSSYKLLMEQAKLKQATSKVSSSLFQQPFLLIGKPEKPRAVCWLSASITHPSPSPSTLKTSFV